MGTDKAEIAFEGRTLLEHAVTTMRRVCEEVVIVGSRERIPEGTVCIPDGVPGCGPMGGIEAALRDCAQQGGETAVFVPVDTPLLPGGLLRALVELWTGSATMRVGMALADGLVQPLISALHVDLLPALRAALDHGNHTLQPALRSAAEGLAERMGVPLRAVLALTPLDFGDDGRVLAGDGGAELSWTPSRVEWERRVSWFANLNTPAELQAARERGEERSVSPSAGRHLT